MAHFFIATGVHATVVEMNIVWRKGVYNPQTVQEDIAMDRIHAYTYGTTIDARAAHGILARLQAFWHETGVNIVGELLESF